MAQQLLNTHHTNLSTRIREDKEDKERGNKREEQEPSRVQLCSEETTLGSNIKHTSKLCDVINRFYFVATIYIHAVTRMCRICRHIKELQAELLNSFLRKQCRVNTSYATECHDQSNSYVSTLWPHLCLYRQSYSLLTSSW